MQTGAGAYHLIGARADSEPVMFLRTMLLILSLSFALGAASSCIGDPGRTQMAAVHNGTRVRVILYTSSSKPDAQLVPSETKRIGWFVAPRQTRQIEFRAYDEAGNLVFCKPYSFSYEEAPKVEVKVEIQEGEVYCK